MVFCCFLSGKALELFKPSHPCMGCQTELSYVVMLFSIFTKKSKNPDNWKENPLNGPPEQREGEHFCWEGKRSDKIYSGVHKIVSKIKMKLDSCVVSLFANSE